MFERIYKIRITTIVLFTTIFLTGCGTTWNQMGVRQQIGTGGGFLGGALLCGKLSSKSHWAVNALVTAACASGGAAFFGDVGEGLDKSHSQPAPPNQPPTVNLKNYQPIYYHNPSQPRKQLKIIRQYPMNTNTTCIDYQLYQPIAGTTNHKLIKSGTQCGHGTVM